MKKNLHEKKSPSLSDLLKAPYRIYILQHLRPFICGLIALIVTNCFDILTPTLIGKAIDQLVNWKDFSTFLKIILFLFLIGLTLSCSRFLWRYFWGQFHHSVAEDLRNRLFSKITDLSPSQMSQKTTGDLMSLINNDVNSFRMAIGPGLLVLFDSLLLLVLVPIFMWKISPEWTWRCLVLMPMIPFIVKSILKKTHVAYDDQQNTFSKMSGLAQEIVSGVRTIKSYAQEEIQTQRFDDSSEKFRKSCNRVSFIDSYLSPILELCTALGCVILLFIGYESLSAGKVSLGEFFAFYQYIQKMVWPMEGLGISLSQYQMGKAAMNRIKALFEETNDIIDSGTQTITDFESLEVRNLTFSYPNGIHPVLSQVSFKIHKGETLGVIGITGSGKTTLVELLCRFYPAPAHTIFINDIPIEEINLKSLRSLIGMVPQNHFLFSKNLSENMTYGSEIVSANEIQNMAQLVHLDQEILSWPEGFETQIGERGINLSGGQKQRVTLARALLKTYPFLIIDDSLSAVDNKTGLAILQKIKALAKLPGNKKTSLIISHKMDHIAWTDKILVLNNGKVEAFGPSQWVLQKSALYQELYELQKQEAFA